MIGRTISRYRLEEKLGEGGMGVVYRASDLRLGRTVALKMLRPELAADVSLRRRLNTEAQATSALNHAGIATLYDFETHEGATFLVYEYIKGKTLRAIQAERPLDLRGLLSVFIGISEAVVAAHDSGIIHRDLKPENVMVREDDGRVKVLDFGLAKLSLPFSEKSGATIATAQTVPGLLLGTIPYMSPEQLEGEDVDHRSDIFSLGTMLYEIAARQHPFEGKSPSSTIGNILKEEPRQVPQWIEGANPDLERIVRKCIRKKKEERFQSVRDILVDLKAIRRDLDSAEMSRSGGIVSTAAEDEFTIPVRETLVRSLFLLIQAGYLALYAAVFYWGYSENSESVDVILAQDFNVWDSRVFIAILVLAMAGIAIRIYLISEVAWKHPKAGRQFVRLFPALLLFDGFWAASPLLLLRKWQFVTLGMVACMAYVAFAQRTLMLSLYPGSRFRDSGMIRPSSRHS